MSEKMNAIERLEELLNAKDEELEEANERADKAERQLDAEPWTWMRQERIETDLNDLPVPRLEIRWIDQNDDYTWIAEYALVYRFFLGEIIRVPLSKTKCSGGGGAAVRVRNGVVETPFRDGSHIAHDMRHLNLPGYAICGEHVTKLEPMTRPNPYDERAVPLPGEERSKP